MSPACRGFETFAERNAEAKQRQGEERGADDEKGMGANGDTALSTLNKQPRLQRVTESLAM